jgi:tetratricopeptide (TPR) repeat protein
VLHLKTALDLDPKFARAASRLGDILTAQFRTDDGLPYHAMAAEIIRERNLTDRESLTIRGLFALDIGGLEEAERIFSRFALEYPDDGLALFYKASAVDRQGRSEEALQLATAAVSLNPESYNFIMQRANFLLEAGRIADAQALCDRAAKLKPMDWTDQLRSGLALAKFDLTGVWGSLENMRANGSPRYRSRAYGFEACLHAEQGKWDEAEHLLREGLDFDQRVGLGPQSQFTKRRLLAQLFLRRQRKAEARNLCRESLDAAPSHRDTMLLGCLLAQAGDLRRAQSCQIQGLPAWPIYEHWKRRLGGELALASGDARGALRTMKSAPPPAIKHEWPEHIARAAMAASDTEALRQCLAPLLENPGPYWVQADANAPGFMSWGASLAKNNELTQLEADHAKLIREILERQ